jgi:hypothetical protein
MTKPLYDFILVWKTMKEIGIVLDFWTEEITLDKINLPMRDINSLTKSKMEKAWAADNSMALEPSSRQEATQQVIHILDTKYEKVTSKQLLAPIVLT